MKKSVVSFMVVVVVMFAAVLLTYTYYEGRGQLYQQAVSTMSEELGLPESFIAASPIGDQLRAELGYGYQPNRHGREIYF